MEKMKSTASKPKKAEIKQSVNECYGMAMAEMKSNM